MHGMGPVVKSFSASQDIYRVLWNLKVPYRVYSSPPFVHILKQINPLHALPSCLF